MTTNNDFSGGTFAGPVVTGGEVRGNVDSHARMEVHAAPDLPALLAALRAELAARPDLSDVDVRGEVAALQDEVAARQGGAPVDAEAARGRWRRIRGALEGLQVAANLTQIGEGITWWRH